jgi:hypothetical protein
MWTACRHAGSLPSQSVNAARASRIAIRTPALRHALALRHAIAVLTARRIS